MSGKKRDEVAERAGKRLLKKVRSGLKASKGRHRASHIHTDEEGSSIDVWSKQSDPGNTRWHNKDGEPSKPDKENKSYPKGQSPAEMREDAHKIATRLKGSPHAKREQAERDKNYRKSVKARARWWKRRQAEHKKQAKGGGGY